jgi:CTP:phosphocholine cytidylyltransferase-like protein
MTEGVNMERWELYKDKEKIADIDQIGADQPWLIGELHPTNLFNVHRDLFTKATRFIENDDFDSEESDKVFETIDELDLKIKRLSDGMVFENTMVSITGTEIWWRI